MLTERQKRDQARAISKREEACDKVDAISASLQVVFESTVDSVDLTQLRGIRSQIEDLRIIYGDLKTECEFLIRLEEHEVILLRLHI